MLVLPLSSGDQDYGIPCRDIASVLPAVPLRKVPHAPPQIAGLFVHRGSVTPVVDLTVLLGGPRATLRLSTRIVLVDFGGDHRRLGLLAERVAEPFDVDEAVSQGPRMRIGDAPYLGCVLASPRGMLQLLVVARLVTPELAQVIFGEKVRENEKP
jgi:chemotaxis-related protein WspB